MSRSRRQFRGSGLGKSDDQVADALTTCINAVRSLAVPSRRRVMRGLNAWILADEVDEAQGPHDEGA